MLIGELNGTQYIMKHIPWTDMTNPPIGGGLGISLKQQTLLTYLQGSKKNKYYVPASKSLNPNCPLHHSFLQFASA